MDNYKSVNPSNQLRVNCDDDSTLLSMVAQGIGVTAMPKLCLQNLPKQVRALELTPATKRVLGVGHLIHHLGKLRTSQAILRRSLSN